MNEPDRASRYWRLRSIHRRMPFDEFERTVPVRPGWKREYYGGMAHVRPSWGYVRFELPLKNKTVPEVEGLRPLAESDRVQFRRAFLDSFRFSPEYADYPTAGFRKKAREYVAGAFGDVRGALSDASRVVAVDGKIVAAAVVKLPPGEPPLLDCVFTRPSHFRRGLATAAVRSACSRLRDLGFEILESGAMLANTESLAWHSKTGFREVPCLMVAESRWRCAGYELHRLTKAGTLTPELESHLKQTAARWRRVVLRIKRRQKTDSEYGYPLLAECRRRTQ